MIMTQSQSNAPPQKTTSWDQQKKNSHGDNYYSIQVSPLPGLFLVHAHSAGASFNRAPAQLTSGENGGRWKPGCCHAPRPKPPPAHGHPRAKREKHCERLYGPAQVSAPSGRDPLPRVILSGLRDEPFLSIAEFQSLFLFPSFACFEQAPNRNHEVPVPSRCLWQRKGKSMAEQPSSPRLCFLRNRQSCDPSGSAPSWRD